MGINDLYNAGEDLVDAVNDAVRRNDYSGLSESIKKTVKDVSETIQRDVREYDARSRKEDIRRRNYRNTAGQGGPGESGRQPGSDPGTVRPGFPGPVLGPRGLRRT